MNPGTPFQYRYHLCNLTGQRSREIVTDSPLPHLEVGHELNVSLQASGEDDIDQLNGGPLVIRGVRLFLTIQKGGWKRYDVWVFCEEQDPQFHI